MGAFSRAAMAAAVLLVLAPLAVFATTPGCSNCAEVTTGLPFTLPRWMYTSCPIIIQNPRTGRPIPWSIPVGKCCGPSPQPPCPAVACAAAFSYSSSGPGQCAQSYSTIEAATISSTQFNAITTWATPILATYCQSTPPTYGQTAYTAAAIANVYAEAIATTLIYHSQFVCLNKFQGGNQCSTCSTCNGGQAYSAVKANVQAVAQAAATSLAVLIAQVNDANGNVLALGAGTSQAFATAINTATDSYFNQLSLGCPWAPTAQSCLGSAPTTQLKTAIAQALSCAFVRVFVSIYVDYPAPDDPTQTDQITPDSTACANSYSASYSIGNQTINMLCPNIDCPNGCGASGTPVTVVNPNFVANQGATPSSPSGWTATPAASGSDYFYGPQSYLASVGLNRGSGPAPGSFAFGAVGSSEDVISQTLTNLNPACQYLLNYNWYPSPYSTLSPSVNHIPVSVDGTLYTGPGATFFPTGPTAVLSFGGIDVPSWGYLTNVTVTSA